MRYRTIRDYDFGEAASAMQKAIRRGDARLAGYWALELFDTGYRDYVWRRLMIISAEDIWQGVTKEVLALREAALLIRKNEKTVNRSAERLL
jgi:replication-associated recombination protein RarA